MDRRLSREERLRIVAELCPQHGTRRACDSSDLARKRAIDLLGLDTEGEVTADYLLMRAVDRYAAGELSLEDLYRCRILAYYMVFAHGGEEWRRWGVAAAVRPGDIPAPPEEADLDDLRLPPPAGPPWIREA